MLLLAVVVPSGLRATVFFSDNFTAGSTTNGISNPTGAATSYDIAATKNTLGGTTINPGDFTLKLNAATTAGFLEAQALFTNNAVTLALPGDFIDISVTFTNVSGVNGTNGLFNTSASQLWVGLYSSGGSLPLAGDLANSGLTTTAGSAFATGNCANWKGYVAQMSSNGVSRFQTRPLQNGANTTSANQSILSNNGNSGGYGNPVPIVIGPATPPAPIALAAADGVYTVYFRITLQAASTLTFSNAIYAGTSTAGTLIYSQTNSPLNAATNANFLTANFDGFGIGVLNKATPASDAIIDITSIQITGQVSPAPAPIITLQPVPISVATNGAGAFTITTMGFGQVYQWHRNGTNISNGGNFIITTSPDSSSSTLAIAPAGLADAAIGANGYWVTVTGTGNLSTNSTTNSLILRVATNLIYNAAGGTIWDVNNTASWKDPNGNTTTFNYGDSVTFDDSVAGSRNVTVSVPYIGASTVRFINDGTVYSLAGSGNIAGPGTMFVSGGVQLGEPNTYTGGTIISNDSTVSALVQINNYSGLGTGPVTFVPSAPGCELELQVGGSASAGLPDLHVNESAIIQLDFTNTFAGVILGGLYGDSGKTLSIEPLSFNTAFTHRLRVYGTNTTYDANLFLDGPPVSQAIYNGTVLAPYNASGVQTYTGVISGNGGIVQRGNGSTVLAGQSTYVGGTFITAGNLGFGADTVGSGPTTGPIGTGPLFIAPEVGSASGSGTVFSSGGPHTVSNPLQYPSVTNNQTIIFGGTNNLTFSGPMTLNGNDVAGSPTNRIVQVNMSNSVIATISGVISDGGNGFGLTKTGTGILALGNTETYGGSTLVNGGTLSVNGTVAGTGVTVATNATLGGTGSISSPVVIQVGGALAPGNSIGILTVNNNLTLSGNLKIEVNTNLAQNCDRTVVSGALTNAGVGTVTVTNVGTSALQTGNRFFLFNKAMSNGVALNIVSPGITVTWSNGLAVDGSIQVLGTIPITPTNITIIASGSTVTMTWPSTYLGWSLQSNSVGLLSTNSWFIVPGSSSGTSVTITRDLTKTNVFYRMSLP